MKLLAFAYRSAVLGLLVLAVLLQLTIVSQLESAVRLLKVQTLMMLRAEAPEPAPRPAPRDSRVADGQL